jgi:hypothetical protein
VRGQLLMWESFLTPRASLLKTEPYPFLGFEHLLAFEVNRGIPDEEWAIQRAKGKEEPKVPAQSPPSVRQMDLLFS